MDSTILFDRSLEYANNVVSGKEIAPKEVVQQCQICLDDYNINRKKQDFEFYFDDKELNKIENLLKLLNFATGFVADKQVLESLAPFQCFLIVNIFAWRYKNNHAKFMHNDFTLFISRKNAKTVLVAIIFILLMLTEQNYSEFYSICLTKELAAEIKKHMEQILNASPKMVKHFVISVTATGKIVCSLTHSYFQPRTAEAGKNNTVRPCAMCSDEHGNFQNADNFNALKGGMKNVINPLVFRTTTAYNIANSIMEEDIDYIRKVLNGVVPNPRQFALLYYASKDNLWNDTGIYESNPLRIEENYGIIRANREVALIKPSAKVEYITKDMNNFLQGETGETYIDFKAWKKCEVPLINLAGKEVVVSVDASLSTDLTAIDITYEENGIYYLIAHAFLPRNTLPNRREKLDYIQMELDGYCTITEGDIVDYNLLEDYIRNIEGKYNCKIRSIVSDPYNITATMQKLSENYEVILLKQSYTVLSPPIKGFRDDVYLSKVRYQKNTVLDWCMSSCTTIIGRTSGDVLLNKVNKNKSRIDLVVAAIFGYSQLYLEKALPYTEDDINDFFARASQKETA